MRKLFDYRCDTCGWADELFMTVPADPTVECKACSSPAKRIYSMAGLMRSGSSLSKIAPASGSTDCQDNPDVPGLCHVAPPARRAMIAEHRGDDHTLAQEKAKQKRHYEQHGPVPLNKVVHSH